MAIEGKVAKILNTRELIINKGFEHGVMDRMKFDVLEPGFDVVDPDTEDNLGHLIRPKITVEIVHTEPLFSVGKTFETFQEPMPDSYFSFTISPRYVTKVKRISEGKGSGFSESHVSVSIGDDVIQRNEAGAQKGVHEAH